MCRGIILFRPVSGILLGLLAIGALPQQIATVDLTEPVPSSGQPHLPSGCGSLEPDIIADGIAKTEDGNPVDLTVEIIELSDDDPVEESDLTLKVRMTNNSNRSITIPWSTDPEIIFKDQSPTQYAWERGQFRILVRNPEKKGATPLLNVSRQLYGTDMHPETMLLLNQNQSIIATIKMNVKSAYPYDSESLAGDVELFAEWDQLGRENSINGCKVRIFNKHYHSFYHQDTPAVPITIEAKPSSPK